MADVTLAECGGTHWLVEGEQHLDELLMGSFSPDLTIEFVTCRDKSDLHRLWSELSAEAGPGRDPWAIHPGLIDRIRSISDPDRAVVFAAWSALIDAEGEAAIADTAARLAAEPALVLTLRQDAPPADAAGVADLQRLRAQLVVAALTRLGCDPGRLRQESVTPESEARPDRIELVTAEPA